MMRDFSKPGLSMRSALGLTLMAAVSPSMPSPPAQQAAPAAKTGPSAESMESFQSQIRALRQQAAECRERAQADRESIKLQMADTGLDMRLDVREAEARMSYLVDKIDSDIEAGAAVSAEADLLMAGYAADYIKRFLGRR